MAGPVVRIHIFNQHVATCIHSYPDTILSANKNNV